VHIGTAGQGPGQAQPIPGSFGAVGRIVADDESLHASTLLSVSGVPPPAPAGRVPPRVLGQTADRPKLPRLKSHYEASGRTARPHMPRSDCPSRLLQNRG